LIHQNGADIVLPTSGMTEANVQPLFSLCHNVGRWGGGQYPANV